MQKGLSHLQREVILFLLLLRSYPGLYSGGHERTYYKGLPHYHHKYVEFYFRRMDNFRGRLADGRRFTWCRMCRCFPWVWDSGRIKQRTRRHVLCFILPSFSYRNLLNFAYVHKSPFFRRFLYGFQHLAALHPIIKIR